MSRLFILREMVAYSNDSARYMDIQNVGLIYVGVWVLQWLVHYCTLCYISLKLCPFLIA